MFKVSLARAYRNDCLFYLSYESTGRDGRFAKAARHARGGQTAVSAHKDAAKNPANCTVCHVQIIRSPLKTWTARTLNIENGKPKSKAGQMVTCYDCHNGPKPTHLLLLKHLPQIGAMPSLTKQSNFSSD
jgi:hypothetical protein